MDEQPEAIRQHIDETRAAMADKLSTLEDEVIDTVKGATEAVADTVESVKDSVVDTVDAVKDTVQETVQSVKRTFDLQRQFDRHPWLLLAGSVATGFLAGRLLGNLGARSSSRTARPALAPASATSSAPRNYSNGAAGNAPSEPGVLSKLAAPLEEGISKLKELAVGSLLGMLRDQAKRALPENLKPQVEEVLNDLTTKLGGKVVPETEDASLSSGQTSSSDETVRPVPAGSGSR